jgi:hypothetical protein
VLLSVPGELEGLQKGIARLCEAWWAAGKDGAQDLTSQTFMFLLEKSLTPGATVSARISQRLNPARAQKKNQLQIFLFS